MAKLQTAADWGRVFYNQTGGLSQTTFSLNSAASGGYSANWLAAGITPLLGGTVSKIRVYVNAVTGTLGASDLVCDIYSDSAGNPNTSLQSSSTVTTTPTGAAWVEFTGFSTALTIGTPYWIVLRNANATPTSNSPTYVYLSNLNVPGTVSDPALGALVFTSTNSGSTWSRFTATQYMVIDYGSGNIEGFAVQSTTSADPQIYSSREGGIKFTTPANTSLNVIGIAGIVSKSGSPTGDLRYRLYTGSSTSPTLVGTTVTRPPGSINTSRAPKALYFSTPITIPASTVVRVVVSETTQSDASTNRYQTEFLQLSSSDTGIFLPFTSNPAYTLSTDGGATFTDTDNRWVAMWLILDTSEPFPAVSGGASSYTFIG